MTNKSWNDMEVNINKCFLPAADEPNSKSIDVLQVFLASNTMVDSVAMYRCSCGEYYFIGDCGNPWVEGKCASCREDIGGTGHNLIERDGHELVKKNCPLQKLKHT